MNNEITLHAFKNKATNRDSEVIATFISAPDNHIRISVTESNVGKRVKYRAMIHQNLFRRRKILWQQHPEIPSRLLEGLNAIAGDRSNSRKAIMNQTIQAALDQLYEIMSECDQPRADEINLLIGQLKELGQQIDNVGKFEYVTIPKMEWNVALVSLKQIGINLNSIPETLVIKQGFMVSVAKTFHDLVFAVLAKEASPDHLVFYFKGLKDMGNQAQPNQK